MLEGPNYIDREPIGNHGPATGGHVGGKGSDRLLHRYWFDPSVSSRWQTTTPLQSLHHYTRDLSQRIDRGGGRCSLPGLLSSTLQHPTRIDHCERIRVSKRLRRDTVCGTTGSEIYSASWESDGCNSIAESDASETKENGWGQVIVLGLNFS